jgi:RNA-splicing ligase RtcB
MLLDTRNNEMQTMKGKYNSANIMIDEIDDTTREQIQGFLNHPAFANTYISIMPDCHAGKGAVIGFTMKVNDYIIPNITGVDIGCGLLMSKFPVKSIDLPKLDEFIKKNIPSGFSINQKSTRIDLELESDIRDVCETIEIESYLFSWRRKSLY